MPVAICTPNMVALPVANKELGGGGDCSSQLK